MSRRAASLLAIALVTTALLLLAPDVFLVIFAGILLDKGVITSAMFTALLLMAVASTC